MHKQLESRIYDLRGVVQGVGFRPSLQRLATAENLHGWVQNRSNRVRMEVQGDPAVLDVFLSKLPSLLPSNAVVEDVDLVERRPLDASSRLNDFVILDSEQNGSQEAVIPADLAMCEDCAREIMDPGNRRYGYPFTTCTACGPRYTVVNAMPYDRDRTTLSEFPLCDECRKEYGNPGDRRFHAESIACPKCGPNIWMETADGEESKKNVLARTRQELSMGAIVAVRGIGGYLLAVDSFNAEALRRLRHRKARPHKPFAVMARDLETLEQYALVDSKARNLLQSAIAPITILPIKTGTGLPQHLLNPDSKTLGAMLPTSPLHKLLFEPLEGDDVPPFDLLVMTSGNHSSEPICISNQEARDRLSGIADLILCHNREINLRNDDSVFVIRDGYPQVWRRARGCAPNAVEIGHSLDRTVLAMGAELKNCVAVGQGSKIIPSPHIGDLENPKAVASLEEIAAQLPAFLEAEPEAIAVDNHPDMQSTLLGEQISEQADVPIMRIQHHYAHAVACLAEHGKTAGLALVMDGTGLGDDGTIWGAELLEVELRGYRRLASFAPVPLPGGDEATRLPSRQLAARFIHAGLPLNAALRDRMNVSVEQAETWRLQIEQGINTPYTRAAGRLFDSVASLLGLCSGKATYEAQAPVRLEEAAKEANSNSGEILPYETEIDESRMLVVNWSPLFDFLHRDIQLSRESAQLAYAFHFTLAEAAMQMVSFGVSHSRHRDVALTGGVFMNGLLTDLIMHRLKKAGLDPLIHRRIPPNDGGIAFGQAAIGGIVLSS